MKNNLVFFSKAANEEGRSPRVPIQSYSQTNEQALTKDFEICNGVKIFSGKGPFVFQSIKSNETLIYTTLIEILMIFRIFEFIDETKWRKNFNNFEKYK